MEEIFSTIKSKVQNLLAEIEEKLSFSKNKTVSLQKELTNLSGFLEKGNLSSEEFIPPLLKFLVINGKNLTLYELEKSAIFWSLISLLDPAFLKNLNNFNLSNIDSLSQTSDKFSIRIWKLFLKSLTENSEYLKEFTNLIQNCISNSNLLILNIKEGATSSSVCNY
jgi:hypothetical protein